MIPLTGSLGGELAAYRARKAAVRWQSRGKKVYGLTAQGETLFEELLAAEHNSGEDDRVFNLRLAFARYLAPDARLGLLERRRAHLVARLTQLRARLKAGRERADGYTHSLIEHDRETVEHDLSWIERLIATDAPMPAVPAVRRVPGPSSDPRFPDHHRRPTQVRRSSRRSRPSPPGPIAPHLGAPPCYTPGGNHSMTAKIRVAIAGVGNCASALVQGIEYYRGADPERHGARPDARRPWWLPRWRRRVRGCL